MPLRYYQNEANEAIFDYWRVEPGHPLVDMATGVGKSLTMADLKRQLIEGWPDMRVMNCTHVVELVEGNFKEFIQLCPFAPAGIWAAGLNAKDTQAQILFAQLQTVWNKAHIIGHVDVMIIDEVHMVPSDGNTMYRKLIDSLLVINPDMKIVGFTATPYRLDSGRLDEGEDKLFDKTVYTYGIRQGIDDGYLTPITSRQTETRQDTSSVPMRGNDLSKTELQKAVDKDELNKAVITEVMDKERHRNCALFFCAGIEHATHIRDILRDFGKTCEVLSGKTPQGERKAIIDALKTGEIWGVTNDNVMSTGTNVPRVDLICDLARTKSASRYVQRVGRGTRVIYPKGFDPEATDAVGRKSAIANGIKTDCRYMDFAGNTREHGPVDMICPTKPSKGEGEAPIKICPQCEEVLHASLRQCWCCGHEFVFDDTPKISAQADVAPVLSTEKPWVDVGVRKFWHHPGKNGKPDSVKVSYRAGVKVINQWVCPGHPVGSFAKRKADQYWMQHFGERPFPDTVLEWLRREGELRHTDKVQLDYSRNPKYPDVVAYKVAVEGYQPEPDDTEPGGPSWDWRSEMDDEVPF